MIMEPVYLSSVVVSNFYNESHMIRSLFYRLHTLDAVSEETDEAEAAMIERLNADVDAERSGFKHAQTCGYKHTQPRVLQGRTTKACPVSRRLTSRNTVHAGYWINHGYDCITASTDGNVNTQTEAAAEEDQERVELMDRILTTTGLFPSGQPTPLCKRHLMIRFAETAVNAENRVQVVTPDLSAALNLIKDNNAPVCYRDFKDCSRGYKRAKSEMNSAIKIANIGRWLQKPMEIDTFSQDLKHLNRVLL